MSTNDRQPIDPASLVPGARITIEIVITEVSEDLFWGKLQETIVMVQERDYPAILSVTPPPVDWSKVKRAVYQNEAADIVAIDGNAAWIRFDRGGNRIVCLASLKPLVSLAPLPDEPSAGEAKPTTKCENKDGDFCRFPECMCGDKGHIRSFAWSGISTPAPDHRAIREEALREALSDLRADGWSVAVHNDYRLHGKAHTFWLFTKGDLAIKGEGLTDEEALQEVLAARLALINKEPKP